MGPYGFYRAYRSYGSYRSYGTYKLCWLCALLALCLTGLIVPLFLSYSPPFFYHASGFLVPILASTTFTT